MAYNCKIELNGVLGQDAKTIEKEDKTFVALRVATTDSYPVKDGEQTIWKNKESLWHDVLVFRPSAVSIAKELKKSEIVEISGSLSYRPFKDENGHTKYEASIIANFVKKIEVGNENEPSEEEISEVVEKSRA
jgi:single stranded DNA-binding protein